MFANRITMNTGINDWLWASVGWLGLDEVTGTDPGTPTPENTNYCAGFNQIKYYLGTVGAGDISGATKADPCVITSTAHGLTTGDKIFISGVLGMTELNYKKYTITKIGDNSYSLDDTDSAAYTTYTSGGDVAEKWTDANDMRLDLTRPDAIADDYRSDGTGKPSSLFPGTFTPAINLMTRFASTHKLATFDNRSSVIFAVEVDTGTDIVTDGLHYGMDIFFPRCRMQAYSVDLQGVGQSVPIINLIPETDPTATWSTKGTLYNDISDYADATA